MPCVTPRLEQRRQNLVMSLARRIVHGIDPLLIKYVDIGPRHEKEINGIEIATARIEDELGPAAGIYDIIQPSGAQEFLEICHPLERRLFLAQSSIRVALLLLVYHATHQDISTLYVGCVGGRVRAGVQVSLDLGRNLDQILIPFCAFPRFRLPLPAQQALGAHLCRSAPSAAAESSHQCCTQHDVRASQLSLMRRGSGCAHRERVETSNARLEHTASGGGGATK